MPSADAKDLGFPTIAQPAHTSKQTGAPHCTNSAQVAYEDPAKKTGLVSAVLVCTTEATATNTLGQIKSTAKTSPQLSPPAELGPTAFLAIDKAPSYVIYWQRGSVLFFTALDADITASATASTKTITPQQQQTLSTAAKKQNAASA
ncbi:MAG: hypothetical protein ACRD1G_17525 [Acidimicrobiales bacterium]